MVLNFKTIEGHNVDVVAVTIQLIDRGEGHDIDGKGMEARYHIMIGDAGWCYVLDKNEYERVKRAFNSPIH